jgi:hypothetical protein
VVSIAGSSKIGAMRVKDQAKWMTAYDEGRWSDLPDERTDDFLPLYNRMKEQTGYAPGDGVDAEVERLHRVRNLLGHIRPISLLVHPADLKQLSRFGKMLEENGPKNLVSRIRSAQASIEEHVEKVRLAIRTGENIRPGVPESTVINEWYREIIVRQREIAAARFVLKYGAVF